ncbi:tetratricopeptide repeat protein [Cerasicoccus frondis]|uniref:tetratricopeptide repeat protein n=1 Tax=Cerasicoccus frondis TaxID=490090 RepID=UPI002852C7AD|nr:tetratricopeptide repeat protein [Cerasicoccus frondis]
MKLRFRRNLKKLGTTGPGGLFRLSKDKSRTRAHLTLHIDPVRLLVLLGILAIIGYIGAVIAAYSIRSKRPHNQITLMDIALPWNWSGLDEKAGETNLAHGKALFEEQDYKNALYLLRNGLKRKPDDLEARLMLAQLNHAIGASEDATNILDIGLNYGYPDDPKYTQLLLVLLALREDFESISSVSRKLRAFPEVKEDPELWEKLADIELNALKKMRNFEQLLIYAQDMRKIDPDESRYVDLELLSKIKLGFIDETLAEMDELSLARKHSPQYRYLEAMIALQTDDAEALEDHIDAIMRWPTKPYPLQAQTVLELDYANLPEQRDQRIDQYLKQYSHASPPLIMGLRLFYQFLTVEEVDALLEQIASLSPDDDSSLQLIAIQSRVLAGRYTEARRLYDAWLSEASEEQTARLQWLGQLLITLEEKRQDDRVALWETMHQRHANDAYQLAVQALMAADDFETAERIAENGLQFYPHDLELAEMRREALAQR